MYQPNVYQHPPWPFNPQNPYQPPPLPYIIGNHYQPHHSGQSSNQQPRGQYQQSSGQDQYQKPSDQDLRQQPPEKRENSPGKSENYTGIKQKPSGKSAPHLAPPGSYNQQYKHFEGYGHPADRNLEVVHVYQTRPLYIERDSNDVCFCGFCFVIILIFIFSILFWNRRYRCNRRWYC